jgi:hypothetical protein
VNASGVATGKTNGEVSVIAHFGDYSFDIAEGIDDFTLLFRGTLNMQGSPTRLTGSFEGEISTSNSTRMPFRPFLAQCAGSPTPLK